MKGKRIIFKLKGGLTELSGVKLQSIYEANAW